ncbi:MAG: zinc ABC transporter substrate-binding protein [Pirellulaceae bacterium]|nr:zinc ABC transporter substrate-binding protein [Pirellulaceae bacterium]
MRLLYFVAVLLVGLTGCPSASNHGSQVSLKTGKSNSKIQVVATVGMVADLVKQVGGDRVDVVQIMGAGVDPHLYKATRDDVLAIMQGDVVFFSGLMLEGKMIDTLESLGKKKKVVAITDALDKGLLLEPEEFEGHADPHIWMDVLAWSKCLPLIAKTLEEYDPEHVDEYRASAESYAAELEKLHKYGVKSIASIPAERRVLITSHDAFNYFGRAYGLEVLGVQGISTESEAGLQRINEFVDLIVARKVNAVFIESSVSPKNIQSLVEGARSKGHTIQIGGELFSDAMGSPGTFEGTYFGMLDYNITTVTRALGGTAPEAGFSSKLTHEGATSGTNP